MDTEYRQYKEIFQGRPLPFAFVNLDHFDANVNEILERAEGKMPIRVASKSVRCVAMLRRVFEASPQFQGIMAYSAREAVFLAGQGFDDILVAYPVLSEVRSSGVCDAIRDGKNITLMIDCEEHVDFLEAAGAEAGVTIQMCLDLDMSSSFPGLHFGVRRSGVTRADQAVAIHNVAKRCNHVRLDSLMGYEAQIAGLQDNPPGSVVKNLLVKQLKQRSLRELRKRRAEVVNALKTNGCEFRFVNGGGTGSVETTIEEDVVTEVTVGSGFFSPTLFDHYSQFRHHPAAGFAIEIVRQPTDSIYTCHGGGYIASGPPGADRLPQPYLPKGASLLPLEGAGEVQTPINYTGPEGLTLGDPVFFRHSKAGEICERFRTMLLVSGGNVVDEVNTYRGDEQCYL